MTRLLLALLMAPPLVVCAQQTPPCAPLVNDLNGDFIVGATDILQLLSAFGENYDMDGDLIPDCVDPCMGVVDECGVCNGSGPQVPVIQSINILLDSTYIADTDSWTVFEAGADTVYAMLCEEPAEFNDCGDPVFMDGYNYETVLIGDQCWFAENLRTRVYTNGDAITSGLTNEEWTSTPAGATAVYGEGEGGCLDAGLVIDAPCYLESLAQYGRLYNWHAVDDARGLCPSGWHVPTDGEWTELEDYVTSQGFDGIEGAALKSTTGWSDGGNGTDDFGFSALPGGHRRGGNGNSDNAGYIGYWWSSSPYAGGAWFRVLNDNYPDIGRFDLFPGSGFSVRCLRDGSLGCTDPDYLEYDAAATVDDGSCATLVVEGCTDPAYTEYDAAANVDDGSCATLVPTCLDVEMDGYTYSVVVIGAQCWFAENLRTTVYANGDAIPSGLTDGEWSATSAGATAVYGEGSSSCSGNSPDFDACDETESLAGYGQMYNWYAVDDARGLCPVGWHVPTDGEWTELEDHMTSQGFSGSEGTALKSTSGWSDGGNGTDDVGFSAAPGGIRGSAGGFTEAGDLGYWWSSSSLGSNGVSRVMGSPDPGIYHYDFDPASGVSIRCVLDAVSGCTDPDYLEYDPAATVDDGSCMTLLDGCTDVEMDGYTYSVVEIGDQCWFAENLRTMVYANGDAIASGLTNEEWASTSGGANAVYNDEDGGCLDGGLGIGVCDIASLLQYGRLYNWYAVDDARGLCPTGWHVPTDGEWTELEGYVSAQGFAGTEGSALKSTSGWDFGGNGTDDFGFAAPPGGLRGSFGGNYIGAGEGGHWWSSSPDGGYAWLRYLAYYNSDLTRAVNNPEAGFSVRCVKDVYEGCTDPNYLEYDPSALVDDGSCLSLLIPCEDVEMDGYTYSVVQIGAQCWFSENLRTTVYTNGDAIPSELTDEEWYYTVASLAGATALYDEDVGGCSLEYGRLYSGYAVDDERGLCPVGWHVPTDGEWTEMEGYIAAQGFSGTEGMALKSTSGWAAEGNGTDDFGFSALPGGLRNGFSGHFQLAVMIGFWWSSSFDLSVDGGGSLLGIRTMNYSSPEIISDYYNLREGLSVRCLKDAE